MLSTLLSNDKYFFSSEELICIVYNERATRLPC